MSAPLVLDDARSRLTVSQKDPLVSSPRHRPHHYRPHHEEISLKIGIGLARSLAFDENTGI